MKISNSKKQLAKIINENGGWRDGANWAVQNKRTPSRAGHGLILMYEGKPEKRAIGADFWNGSSRDRDIIYSIDAAELLPNWHQTILSRDEYFYLYPAPVKAAPAPKPVPVPEVKHTIEQLAADYRNAKDYAGRKQKEADAAKADAEAKLAAYVAAAGSAVGLVLSVVGPEPELVITDWRDLQVGDVIECVGDWEDEATNGKQFAVTRIDKGDSGRPIRIEVPGVGTPGTWGRDFKFIRRPAKETTNA